MLVLRRNSGESLVFDRSIELRLISANALRNCVEFEIEGPANTVVCCTHYPLGQGDVVVLNQGTDREARVIVSAIEGERVKFIIEADPRVEVLRLELLYRLGDQPIQRRKIVAGLNEA